MSALLLTTTRIVVTVVRSFTCRLYPNATQTKQLTRWIEEAAYLWNRCLAHRKRSWDHVRKPLSDREMLAFVDRVTGLTLPQDARQNQCLRVQHALKLFQDAVRSKTWRTYPRFLAKHRGTSFTLKKFAIVERKRIVIPGLGSIKMRGLPNRSFKPQAVTIKRDADKFYAIVQYEDSMPVQTLRRRRDVGIDLGLASTVTLSNGKSFKPSQKQRRLFRQLKNAVKKLEEMVPGDSSYQKLERNARDLRRRLKNQQREEAHRISGYICARYETIYVEDIQIRPMSKHGNNDAKGYEWSVSNAGWQELLTILEQKSARFGCQMVRVDPKNSSKECSSCGKRHNLTLNDRWLNCDCGLAIPRDINAAKNILNRGRNL